MRIATYNINGIRRRRSRSGSWRRPATLPSGTGRAAGTAWPSCRAAASRCSRAAGCRGGPDPSQSRYIEAAVNGILVGCLYAPNGNPELGQKWDYKLAWLKRFTVYAKQLLALNVPVILAGDYNITPAERDVYNRDRWPDDALFLPQVRKSYASLLKQG